MDIYLSFTGHLTFKRYIWKQLMSEGIHEF